MASTVVPQLTFLIWVKQGRMAHPTLYAPLSDPLVDVAFVMLEIGEHSMHVNARGPTETHLPTALEILCIKEQKMDHLPLLRNQT